MSSRIIAFELENYDCSRIKPSSCVNKIDDLEKGVILICDQLTGISNSFNELTSNELSSTDFNEYNRNIIKITNNMIEDLKSIMINLLNDTLVRIKSVCEIDASFALELEKAESIFGNALQSLNGYSNTADTSLSSRNLLESSANNTSNPDVYAAVIANSELVQEFEGGAIRSFTDESGKAYDVYIPNNVNPDTPVLIYEHGDPVYPNAQGISGYDRHWKNYLNLFEGENTPDAIVIRGRRNNTEDFYGSFTESIGLNKNTLPITVGYSGGAPSALSDAAKTLAANPNMNGGVVTLLDGVYEFNQSQADLFSERGTKVLTFLQNKDAYGYEKQCKQIARSGVDTLLLYDQSVTGTLKEKHTQINNSFTNNGVMDYVIGNGTLPDNYKIVYYNSSTKKFETVDYDQVSTMDRLNAFFSN